MEELDLKDMFNYFLTKKLYIIAITLVALFLAIIYSQFIQQPLYKSYTTILLTKESNSSTITSNDIALNRNLVDIYREIIKSRNVVSKVIKNLNLDYTVDELNSRISVSNINDTEIIKILVVDADSELAMNIANETASVFNNEIVKLYNIQNIGIVDEAEIAPTPYNVNVLKQELVACMVGFVLGIGIVFIMFYFDTTVKSSDEIEKKLGLPVIGEIPKSGGKK